MEVPVFNNFHDIERREWHLWILAIVLILGLGSLTLVAYAAVLDLPSTHSRGGEPATHGALWGLGGLIFLFCTYVLHSHSALVKMRGTLERKAIRDDLTDLYNRPYFTRRFMEEISRSARSGNVLALLICDIDHFKVINDSHGHEFGDDVLLEVATSIKSSTRGSDLVARWGGDEIIIALTPSSREGVLIAAERIQKNVFKVATEKNIELDISIGIAFYPEHGTTVDELVQMADRALYIAKKGGDKIHVGEEEYRLDEQAVYVVFQPVIDIRTQGISGYEALSRDPQGKLSILELFKKYEAVGQLGELKNLCFKMQLQAAEAAGLKKVFINVDFNMLNRMEPISKPPGMEVILEISEKEALIDIKSHLKTAMQWKDRGFKFAIDDFGGGFISLPFISQLIPDYIKMDRETILQSVSSDKFKSFLTDIVLAMRNYSRDGIIAEGVETEAEYQIVKEIGSDHVQGFLLGKPARISEIQR
jgi:diguanylate cyclase (GGDEF)-like protein